ncbi:MAG: Nramp family divalent metal transporter [Candidatus Eremiobacteraeota bacterium]|nr:Nramp family divalent metal transporter [Candidatus Eremiobacteraeota bacterium]
MADPQIDVANMGAKPGEPPHSRVLRFVRNLGPGLITGAADDDPSGISTYSVTGATTGLSMLWVALITTPMMAVIQGMCARISMVSGIGLAAQMKKTFPNWLAFSLALVVVVANTFNVGADFSGMAASAHLVMGLPVLLWVLLFGALLLVAQIWFSYRVLGKIFKWLTLALFAYIITAFIVHPNWLDVLKHTVVPEFHLNGHWITTLVGVLGTTISPYLFFWQSSLMVEEEKELGRKSVSARKGATRQEIVDAHADVNTGMIFSNLVMFFIITTTAVTLFAHGKHDIATAQDAAEALRPLAGNFAYILFAVGMIGTGMLAIPVLAGSSAYVAAEMLNFKTGLNETPKRAPRFYAILAGGVVVGIIMNLIGIDPIKALFWSAVLNGVAAVPLVYAIVHIAGRSDIMGKWKSSLLAKLWGWATFILMAAAAVLMFVYWNHQ